MDITIQREALLKPLQAISGIVDKKQVNPVLSNVLLTVDDDHLLLTGTDTEIELVGRVRLESLNTAGKTTVAARKLSDICRTLPEGSLIRLSLDKNYLVVRAADSHFMLNTLAPDDFPDLEEANCATQFTIKQHQLKNLLAKTYFAMGQQDVRHFLNGTFLDIAQNTIKCVATDGHRLALMTIHDDSIGNVEARVILPRKSVMELMRLLDADGDLDANIHIGESRFRIVTPNYTFTSKLINAQYPDYTRLIPRGSMTATGDREGIKQALTRASILLNEKFRGVRCQLEPNMLRITANNADQEQAEEAVTLIYEGSGIEIGFNVAYLLDAVSSIATKAIRCVFTGPNDGVLIEPVDGEMCTYVVMPMRI